MDGAKPVAYARIEIDIHLRHVAGQIDGEFRAVEASCKITVLHGCGTQGRFQALITAVNQLFARFNWRVFQQFRERIALPGSSCRVGRDIDVNLTELHRSAWLYCDRKRPAWFTGREFDGLTELVVAEGLCGALDILRNLWRKTVQTTNGAVTTFVFHAEVGMNVFREAFIGASDEKIAGPV